MRRKHKTWSDRLLELWLLLAVIIFVILPPLLRSSPLLGILLFSVFFPIHVLLYVMLLRGIIIYPAALRKDIPCGPQPVRSGPESWLRNTSFRIPGLQREALIGDLTEDYRERKKLGRSEFRIRLYILWQLMIVLVTLWPVTILSALKAKLKSKC